MGIALWKLKNQHMNGPMPRVCHAIYSVSKYSGGSSYYLQSLFEPLATYASLTLLTKQTAEDVAFSKEVKIKDIFTKKLLNRKKELGQYSKTDAIEIFHGHGLWQYPVHLMAKVARKNKLPYVISPHGMLEPWSLSVGSWKKRVALKLFQRKDLDLASSLHATSTMEADNIRKLGFKNAIAIIPNGIALNEFPFLQNQTKGEKRTVLFLSRVHPKKGIENLIEAWGKVEDSLRHNWEIQIAGNG